jgi:hypothetical protein
MSPGEEQEGMGTSGEIRRTDPEVRMREAFAAELAALRAELQVVRESPTQLVQQTSGEEPTGVEAYADFVADELEAQDKRKTSFEQRGLAVITTSGALVTVLFALAALSTKEADTFVLPHAARTWLFIGLGLFFFSAVAALLTNAPFIYQAVDAESVRERLREDPPRKSDAAIKDIAYTRIDALESAKAKNSIKGWALAAAIVLEALAVGCVAVAVTIIL